MVIFFFKKNMIKLSSPPQKKAQLIMKRTETSLCASIIISLYSETLSFGVSREDGATL